MGEIFKQPDDVANVDFGAAAEADFQAQSEDALVAKLLDHLLYATDGAASTLAAANVADGSIIAKLASKTANGAAPENFNCTTDSLEAISDALAAGTGAATALAAFLGTKPAGWEQAPVIKTVNLNQEAGDKTVFTGTTQNVELRSLRVKLPAEAAGGDVTSIAVVVTDATEQTIIDTKLVAVLTSQAEFSWVGACTINVGSLIKLRLGGGAHGSEYLVSLKAVCSADVTGGYLA